MIIDRAFNEIDLYAFHRHEGEAENRPDAIRYFPAADAAKTVRLNTDGKLQVVFSKERGQVESWKITERTFEKVDSVFDVCASTGKARAGK